MINTDKYQNRFKETVEIVKGTIFHQIQNNVLFIKANRKFNELRNII